MLTVLIPEIGIDPDASGKAIVICFEVKQVGACGRVTEKDKNRQIESAGVLAWEL